MGWCAIRRGRGLSRYGLSVERVTTGLPGSQEGRRRERCAVRQACPLRLGGSPISHHATCGLCAPFAPGVRARDFA